ncbi:MAG: tetratricopeptide repeat protein, partial [Planctomycetota bacterium]
ALAQEPQRDGVRLRLAEALLESGRPLDARRQLEVLQRKQPGDAAVLVKLARCHIKLGNVEQARELVDGVLARDPDNVEALIERGQLAFQAGEIKEAERWWRKAEKHARFDRQIVFNLAQVLERSRG